MATENPLAIDLQAVANNFEMPVDILTAHIKEVTIAGLLAMIGEKSAKTLREYVEPDRLKVILEEHPAMAQSVLGASMEEIQSVRSLVQRGLQPFVKNTPIPVKDSPTTAKIDNSNPSHTQIMRPNSGETYLPE